jgi:hypothetical protein
VKVAGGWRRPHNEGLRNLYTSPNIVRMIKSRRIIWAGRVARMVQMRNACNILVGKRERRYHLEDVGVDGKIILEWILGK